MSGIYVRIAYQFVCAECGREENLRFPFNPMQELPDVQQSVPEGWILFVEGSNPQTPVALCGCQNSVKREFLN